MRIIKEEYRVYKYDELSEDAKEKAIEKLYDINVDNEWWDSTYEDAENIGLKITGFDLDRNRHATGKFLASAEEAAHKIEKEHGDQTETYKTAKAYLETRDSIINTAEKDENGEFADEYQLDQGLDDADEDFLKSILEDYSIMLQKEYEYLTSREAIEETIRANDYDFTEDGKLF